MFSPAHGLINDGKLFGQFIFCHFIMMTTWVMKWVQKEKLFISSESFERLAVVGGGRGAGRAGSVYLSCSCQFRCWCQTDWSPPLTELTGTQETCHLSPDPLRPDSTGAAGPDILGGAAQGADSRLLLGIQTSSREAQSHWSDPAARGWHRTLTLSHQQQS